MLKKSKLLRHLLLACTLLISGSSTTVFAVVVTSIRPLGFIASAITDGVMATEVLLPDGASPHNYALRPSDVQRLRDADLVIWVGPEMETFLIKSLTHVATDKQIALSKLSTIKPLLIKNEKLSSDAAKVGINGDSENHNDHIGGNLEDIHSHYEYNMHIWLSISIVRQAAIAIHNQLLELVPQDRDKLDANLRQFEDQLAQTEKNVGIMLASVQGKGYFFFHDAWGYFEKDFGLAPLGYFTVNPEIQPGAQHLHQIRTKLVEQKAVCIFAEPQFRPAVINAVANGTGVRSGTLDPLGSGIALSKDSYVSFLSKLSQQYVSCLN